MPNTGQQQFTRDGLVLTQGAVYSINTGAENGADLIGAFETDGVEIDTTAPTVRACLTACV